MGLFIACDESIDNYESRWGNPECSIKKQVLGVYASVVFTDESLAKSTNKKTYPKCHDLFSRLNDPTNNFLGIPWNQKYHGFNFKVLTGEYYGNRSQRIIDTFNQLIQSTLDIYAIRLKTRTDQLKDVTILIDGHEFQPVTELWEGKGFNVNWVRYGDERVPSINTADAIANFIVNLSYASDGIELIDKSSKIDQQKVERIRLIYDDFMKHHIVVNSEVFTTSRLEREIQLTDEQIVPSIEQKVNPSTRAA